MRTCKEISKLASESMDRDLSFGQRMEIKFHMMMCSACRVAAKQVKIFKAAIKAYTNFEDHSGEQLPEDAKQRIKQSLKSDEK